MLKETINRFLASKLTKDIFWNICANIAVKVRGIILIPVITYSCGIQWYGAWVLMYALVSYCNIFGTLMLSNAFVRFYPEEKNPLTIYSLILSSVLAVSVICASLVMVLSDWISTVFLKGSDFGCLFFWGSFLIVLQCTVQLIGEYFRARDDLNRFSLIQSAFAMMEVVTVSVVVLVSRNILLALKTYLACGFAVEACLLSRILKPGVFRTMVSRETLTAFWRYLKYALPLVPGGITTHISATGDRFVLGYFLNAKSVGVYSVAYSLASGIMMFNPPITNSLFPKVAKAHAVNNTKEVRSSIRKGILMFGTIGVGILCILAVFGKWLLYLLSGRDSIVNELHAFAVTMIVGLSLVMYGMSRIYSLHLYLFNETKTIFLIFFVGALSNFIANIFLIQVWDLIGAAAATLASYCIIAAMIVYFIQKKGQGRHGGDTAMGTAEMETR